MYVCTYICTYDIKIYYGRYKILIRASDYHEQTVCFQYSII